MGVVYADLAVRGWPGGEKGRACGGQCARLFAGDDVGGRADKMGMTWKKRSSGGTDTARIRYEYGTDRSGVMKSDKEGGGCGGKACRACCWTW